MSDKGKAIAVTGGRDYEQMSVVFRALDKIHAETPISTLVHGGAWGADELANQWAALKGVDRKVYEVTREAWVMFGPSAGPRRNALIAAHPGLSLLVAFPGGRGTADMARRARKAGIAVLEIAE